MFKRTLGVIVIAALPLTAWEAHGAMAVVDVKAILQMSKQLSTLQNQLSTARDQLNQALTEYRAMTGSRGMENLLRDTVRNYLPDDWAALTETLESLSATYSQLSSRVRDEVERNAVLTDEQLASMSERTRRQVQRDRQLVATSQVMTREALGNTSQRFTSVQQLIDAIPRATDQKAVLDLQARIGAEQAMLQNEQIKLQMLQQTLEAEEKARQQRARERAIADIGSFKGLPPMVMP